MKRYIFVCTIALLTALISLSWNSIAQAQSSSRRLEWQNRILQDVNPTAMTPATAFGDRPLLAQRDWQLNPVPEQGEIIVGEAPSVLDPMPENGTTVGGCGCANECDDCNGCESNCCEYNSCGCCCNQMCCGLFFPQTLNPILRRTQFFGGVHSFKGPIDQGSNGNFGFHGGFNLSGSIGGLNANGYQLGMNLVGSDYSGSTIMGNDTGDRKQIFFTGGLFHRALNGGMQAGAVYDFLQDSFYFGRAHVGQIRAEVSWGQCGYQEFGFWGAFRTKSDNLTQTVGTQQPYNWEIKPKNLYAFFYRRHFCEGGEGRIWGGFSGDSDGMVGADVRVPLGKSLAIESGFNYLIPKEGRGVNGTTEESWGLVMNLVWYPGRSAKSITCDPFRPFFGVGNNNTFMTNMQ